LITKPNWSLFGGWGPGETNTIAAAEKKKIKKKNNGPTMRPALNTTGGGNLNHGGLGRVKRTKTGTKLGGAEKKKTGIGARESWRISTIEGKRKTLKGQKDRVTRNRGTEQ